MLEKLALQRFVPLVQNVEIRIFANLILILEFDDVTVKTIACFLSSLERDRVGGPRFVPSLLKTY